MAVLQTCNCGGRARRRVLALDPFFQPLRDEPQFRALLKRMHVDIARQADGVRAMSDSLARISQPPR